MGVTGEWQRGPVIGRGASATVSIATYRRTGGVFAVKSVEIARAGMLQREQSVLSVLSSPYVVSCLGADVSAAADGSGRPCYDLFLEYAPGGSLADEIKRRGGRCEEAVIRTRAADVLRGLAYVHAAGVAHCDVKGRNVLLAADGRAMLADFGCARWTAGEGAGAVVRGTPMFMSPEAARGEAQGAAADIWALGCTVIEMATGGAPWQQRFADAVAVLHHVAHSGDAPKPPAWLSDEAKDFLSRCLARDPAKRWSAEQLLQHPFVAFSSPAAPVDPSACAGKAAAAPVELRVSPKSVLDQAFWEDSDSDTAVAATPADRVRALAHGVVAGWTWSSGEHWITVCAHTGVGDDNGGNDTAASPGFEAGAGSSITGVSGEQIGSGGGGGEHMRVDAPRGHAWSHGHHQGSSAAAHGDADASSGSGSSCSCSSPRRNGAISGGNSDSCCSSSGRNSASTGNKQCRCSAVNDAGLVTSSSELAAAVCFPACRLVFITWQA
ncbi:unnamed protein product [Urochloa humidicola]